MDCHLGDLGLITAETYVMTEHIRKASCQNCSFIISGFGIYGAAVVPDSGVGNTWQRLTLVLHEFLSNGLTPSRLHTVISFLTHADHVFLGICIIVMQKYSGLDGENVLGPQPH